MMALAARFRFIPEYLSKETKLNKTKQVNQYRFMEILGKGANSTVELGVDTNTQVPYAIKVINIKQNGGGFDREVRLLRQLKHPNVVKLHEVLHDNQSGKAYLVLEFASVGSLSTLIRGGVSEATISGIFSQICLGLTYLHQHGIAHRDIKPSNILLFEKGIAKLGDFGVGHSFLSAETVLGSPAYQAPEIFSEDNEIELDPAKEDIWSLGITIYETAFGELPFNGSNIYEVMWRIRNEQIEIPVTASESFTDLLIGMLKVNPNERFTLEEVRNHRFFRQNKKSFPMKARSVPKLNSFRSITDIKAAVCDEDYRFVAPGGPKSLSGLYCSYPC